MNFIPPFFVVGNYRQMQQPHSQLCDFAGYSGSHAAVVGSVVVTNLVTGKRYGGWESAEVQVAANLELIYNLDC